MAPRPPANTTPPDTRGGVRLQKYMAACGIAARRKCEDLIRAGRVTVNGVVITEQGTKIDPDADAVGLDGRPVRPPAEQFAYFLLNKPAGYLVAASDWRGRRTIYDLAGDIGVRVVPVGRLDLDSEGLLLLTNDGELAHRLMHPSFRVEKEYVVTVTGRLAQETCRELRDGVELEEGRTLPAKVRILGHARGETQASIAISEGRKRQVRRMFDAVGHRVTALRRVREGSLCLGDLASGRLRPLTTKEIASLRREVGLER